MPRKRQISWIAGATALGIATGVLAQNAAVPPAQDIPPPLTKRVAFRPEESSKPMSFFVTSVGLGHGAKLGGITGADAHCQALATAVGRGNSTWHAYLSTQGSGGVNARDRIGTGPWYNAKGQRVGDSVAQIHGDTIEDARAGVAFGRMYSLTEKGDIVPGVDEPDTVHNIITGSRTDGRAFTDGKDHTCEGYTSDSWKGSVQVGHSDKQGGIRPSWNSAHPSAGCDSLAFREVSYSTKTPNAPDYQAGRFYCFAVN